MGTNPIPHQPDLSAIPGELRDHDQWVSWRGQDRDGKQTKAPIDVHTSRLASTTDPTTWGTFDDAVAFVSAGRADGVGFVFTTDDSYVGVDLDHCRDADTGALEPWAAQIVEELGSYAEVSPSGTGVHIIVSGELPPGRRRRGQVEMYSEGRYFTMTGAVIPDAPLVVGEASEALADLHARTFGADSESTDTTGVAGEPDDLVLDLLRTEPEFAALMHGTWTEKYPSQSEADLALCSLLAHRVTREPARIDRLFRRSGLYRPKWDERRGARTYGRRTIEKALGRVSEAGLPVIFVSDRPLRDQTTDALRALGAGNTPEHLFLRGSVLTRVSWDEAGRGWVEPLGEAGLRGELARAAEWRRETQHGVRDVAPPLDVVRDVHSLGAWPYPPLEGLAEAPFPRPDGSIVDQAGYDPATRLYYAPAPSFRLPPIPDQPSVEEVQGAVTMLGEVIADFPFVDEASRANALALLLTPILRPLIDGPVPLAAIDKPQSGTGASLLAESVGSLALGRPPGFIAPTDSEEEMRKRITALLLTDHSIAVLDNVHNKLASASLSVAITSSIWEDRRLGHSEMLRLPQRTTWIVTGNNLELPSDLARRAYSVRLDAHSSQPWRWRTFRHPKLPKWIVDHRADLLAAALTLARAWIVAGQPAAPTPNLGGFESWTETLGGVLGAADVRGFLENQTEMHARLDRDTVQWERFLRGWRTVFGDRAVAARDVHTALAADEDFQAALPPELADRFHEHPPQFNRALGASLAKREDRRFGDHPLHIARGDPEAHGKVERWRVRAGSAGSAGSGPSPTRSDPHAQAVLGGEKETPQTPQGGEPR